MNNKYLLTVIFVTAVVTYLPRVLPFAIFRKKIKNKFILSFLTYMPYGVLSAMIFPAIFTSTSSLVSASIGTLVALYLSYKNKGLLTVAFSAVITVLMIELVIL